MPQWRTQCYMYVGVRGYKRDTHSRPPPSPSHIFPSLYSEVVKPGKNSGVGENLKHCWKFGVNILALCDFVIYYKEFF